MELFAALGTWVGAFTTLFAVVLALRLERARKVKERPRLVVSLAPTEPMTLQYVLGRAGDYEELWIRLAVRNESETPARDVQVRLGSVLRGELKVAEGRPQLWLKASNLNATTIGLLPRGITQYFDVAFLKNTRGVGASSKLTSYLVLGVPDDLDDEPWPSVKQKIEHSEDTCLEIGGVYTIVLWALTGNGDAFEVSLRLQIQQPPPISGDWKFGQATLKDVVHLKQLPK